MIPTVLERHGNETRAWDIYSRLLENRLLFLNSEVNDRTMGLMMACLLHLDHQDSEKPIYIYVNTGGGSCSAGLMLTDCMTYLNSPIVTICTGLAASMGSIILSHKIDRPGSQRLILPNAKVMLHSVSSGTSGVVHDQKIAFEESMKVQDNLMSILAHNTSKTKEEIETICQRDKWFSAQEAVDFGLVDAIITHKPKV